MTTVYLSGEYLPLEQAKVSVLDRGFLLGDGIYEVVPVYNGKTFRATEHWQRWQRSLALVGMDNPIGLAQWHDLLHQVITRNELTGKSGLYVQITRGVAPRNHVFPDNVTPTVLVMPLAVQALKTEVLVQGLSCITLPDQRWLLCHIKSISLMGHVLGRQQAHEHGCDEVIFIRDGWITEASASNVIVVKNNQLYSPHKDNRMLWGATLGVIEELIAELSLNLSFENIPSEWLWEADEVLLTGSIKEVMPVCHIDQRPIGKGQPGAVFQQLYQRYQERIHCNEAIGWR